MEMLQMSLQHRKTLTDLENNLWLWGGAGGTVRESEMDMCTLLYLKWITNKALLHSAWNLLNVIWQPRWEGI